MIISRAASARSWPPNWFDCAQPRCRPHITPARVTRVISTPLKFRFDHTRGNPEADPACGSSSKVVRFMAATRHFGKPMDAFEVGRVKLARPHPFGIDNAQRASSGGFELLAVTREPVPCELSPAVA